MTKPRRPNIVLVILDALRYDRLGLSGYRPALTPVLDRLAATGINCTRHFSVGCPTQVAFPGMFTSTLPFDHGGYTDGIHGRPCTFVEVLREGGYHTFGITTGHPCSSHFGYDRGFDEFIDLIDMYQWFRAAAITALMEPVSRWRTGGLDDDSVIRLLETKYRRVLEDSRRYLETLDRVDAAERGRRRSDWRQAVAAEMEILARDPLAIARRIAALGSEYHWALGMPSIPDDLMRRMRRQAAWDARLNRRVFLRSRRKAFPASEVNRQVERFLRGRPRPPFFAMIHYFDLHESKLLLANLTPRRLVELPRDVRRALRERPSDLGGGLLYDVGLADQDRKVGRMLDIFSRAGLLENTIFLFTADHGVETGKPYRGVGSDLSMFFFDNFVHVPLIVNGPGVGPETVTALMSHLDLGPTILDLAGLPVPEGFRGLPLARRASNPAPHLVFENAGKGRCDLDSKTLYVGVRTAETKVVVAAERFVARERDAFDLRDDPDEKRNLAGTDRLREERAACLRVAQMRLDEVRSSLPDATPETATAAKA